FNTEQGTPAAKIVKCRELVGSALQDVVEGHNQETDCYSIYDVEQDIFKEEEWIILSPQEMSIRRKLSKLPTIQDFLYVRQGWISGNNDVFILSENNISKGEEKIFVPLLSDREMRAYRVPDKTDKHCFYPFIDNMKVTQEQLRVKFPKTWAYLLSKK